SSLETSAAAASRDGAAAMPTDFSLLTVPSTVAPESPVTAATRPPSTGLPSRMMDIFALTNGPSLNDMPENELLAHVQRRLEIARYLRMSRQVNEAEPILIELLGSKS